ncbi:MAG TPA: tetratricopeptide repeat protein, partial [Gemmatimonadetes bacterium]|nr:tetratricopeptide repeat protein [Gemmatimonadota bacterium]
MVLRRDRRGARGIAPRGSTIEGEPPHRRALRRGVAAGDHGAGGGGMSGLDSRRRIVISALIILCSPCLLTAQDRSLDGVERLASTGRADEARAMLLEWWENDRPEARRADLQLGLWLRGRLTVDPGQAARDFRRLVIEYPGGRYTDQALFRLAQGSLATGDGERARTYLASLTRDYPSSPVGEYAEAWMARAVAAGPPPVLRRVEVEDAQDDDA